MNRAGEKSIIIRGLAERFSGPWTSLVSAWMDHSVEAHIRTEETKKNHALNLQSGLSGDRAQWLGFPG